MRLTVNTTMPSTIVPVTTTTATTAARSFSVVPSQKGRLVAIEESHYSATKFLALHAYCSTANPLRVLAVLALTPLPALLCAALPSLVPLQDPTLGFSFNHSILVHVFFGVFVSSVGVILLTLGGTATPSQMYPASRIISVSLATMAVIMVFAYLKLKFWRFPMPFLILMESPEWFLTLAGVHVVFLRDKFKQFPELAASIKAYRMPLLIQSAQFGVYSTLTIVFDGATTGQQVILILVFPLVKYLLKKTLRHFTRHLKDMSAEITVSTVEICASLYQSALMQNSQSPLTLSAIMAVDIIQGLVSIKFFMERRMKTPRREVFSKALAILERSGGSGDPSTLRVTLDPGDALVVDEAFELASRADMILLVEYFEVSVPIVNVLFLLMTFQTTSTLYNTRTNRFYDNPQLVASATKSVLLYSLLQGISLLVFQIVLRHRFNMSALYHLAFVLEHHARSIQGKLILFFTLIFYFTLLHYGADFSLRFDYEALMSHMQFPPHVQSGV